ncbi:hypothetical protein [Pseudomonas sp. 37 R 15]|nr:hypothetical protein [Pseudomonas sp. 37 R 15]
MGQLVGARVKLGIGQGDLTEYQRWRIRRALGLVFNQVMDRAFGWVRPGCLVPGLDQPLLLLSAQHRQLADALFTVRHHRLQQADPMAGHALDGRRVEQVVGVRQRGMQGA